MMRATMTQRDFDTPMKGTKTQGNKIATKEPAAMAGVLAMVESCWRSASFRVARGTIRVWAVLYMV